MRLNYFKAKFVVFFLSVICIINVSEADVVSQGGTGSNGVGNILLNGAVVVDVGHIAYFNGATTPASSWVWSLGNTTGIGNPLEYTFSFSLDNFDVSTAELSGLWGVDNVGSVSLNGTLLADLPNLVSGNFNTLHPLSVLPGSNAFVSGLNVLTFTVADLGLPGAFRASIEVTADPIAPIAEYRLDEISWNGTPNEALDNSGNNHHGVATGMTTLPSGKICSAGDFTNTGTSDYVSLANTAANGLNDFTVSVWAMKNVINTGTIFSGSKAGQDNEMLMYFPGNSTFQPYLKGSRINFNNGGIGDGKWHHIVWTRSGTTQCYYVDGIQIACSNSGRNGPITIDSGGLIIGQEQDAVGGRFVESQAWDGLLDELMIFDSALPLSNINTIYTNQNSGNNYDGSARVCPPELTPLLEYRFEETSWNGTTGEIIDSSGNEHHGQVNNNSTPITTSPALSGDPGTCGYASQNDGSIEVTGLPLDTTTFGVKTTVTFWMNWDGSDSTMPIGWNIHDIWIYRGSIGFNTGNSDIYGTSSNGLANGWHHISVEFTNGNTTGNRMYIDGVEQTLTQRLSTPNTLRAYVDSEFRVGGWSINSGYDFHGLIDEVRIYQGVLTTVQVNKIMAERHPCIDTGPHHFEIQHDGSGLTCDAETLTLKACNNASCSSLSTESITLDVLGNGIVIGSKTFTSSDTVSFNHTNVEDLTLSLANSSVTASNPLVCDDGSGSSCDIAFSDAGFRFLYGSSNTTTLPNQVSGSEFGDTLKIQAVKANNGVCVGLFNGNKNIELSQENIEPGGTSGLNFSINNTTTNIAKHPNVTSISLNFDAESIATIPTPIYHDAGRIRLHANYDVDGVTLSGSSNNSFWVSPAKLVAKAYSNATSLDGASATSTTTFAAGEDFSLSVTALNSLDVITPNYSPGQIHLTLARTGPTLAVSVDGNLTYAASGSLATGSNQDVSLTNFTSGVSTYNGAHYSEVGLLNLTAQDIDYGNSGILIPSTVISVGRFIPDHFTQTVAENGSFMATCNTGTTFAYSGQKDEATNSVGAISYLTNPVLEITARNKQGEITQNYYEDSQGSVNDYMKLSNTGVDVTKPTADETTKGNDGNYLPLTANLSTGVLTTGDLSQNDLTTSIPANNPLPKGVLHYQLLDDDFFYNRSADALVTPFTADIDFSINTIIDEDSVDLIPTVGSSTTTDASPTGIEIRFGRLVLENSFGPETSNLPQPMQVEYLDNTGFVLSLDDNCSTYNANKLVLTNTNATNSLNPADTSKQGGTGNFIIGKTREVELEAPGAEKQGEIGVSYDSYDWLKFDWNNDDVHDNNPSAIATFGLFRGNDRIIYTREIFN